MSDPEKKRVSRETVQKWNFFIVQVKKQSVLLCCAKEAYEINCNGLTWKMFQPKKETCDAMRCLFLTRIRTARNEFISISCFENIVLLYKSFRRQLMNKIDPEPERCLHFQLILILWLCFVNIRSSIRNSYSKQRNASESSTTEYRCLKPARWLCCINTSI